MDSSKASINKKLVINMPQMAIEALSENWLFKELGDLHWALICQGLNTKSFDLKNDTGSRLYATFVRIRLLCTESLHAFHENEEANLSGSISRFGESMYFSNINFDTGKSSIQAELMTTFSIRAKDDNTKLAKSEPNVEENNVPVSKTFPSIGNQYRLMKKGLLTTLDNEKLDTDFLINDEVLHSLNYDLNPFYDINGVNLLYFAAYPIINDVCESRVMNSLATDPDEVWEQTYFTKYKDVFYYANCNATDSLTYELKSIEYLDGGVVKLCSVLKRNSDSAVIAKIFTLKQKVS